MPNARPRGVVRVLGWSGLVDLGSLRVRKMSRRMALAVLAGFALAVLLASVSTAGEVPFWHAPPPKKASSFEPTTETAPPVTLPLTAVDPPHDDPAQVPGWLGIVLQLLAFVIVLGLVVMVGLRAR